MGDERTSVGKVFIEYVIINKAKNEGVALQSLSWEDEAAADDQGQLLSLTIRAGLSHYVEHFLEEEIRHCLTRPECFNAVERKISYLFGRIRKDRGAQVLSATAPASHAAPPAPCTAGTRV